MSAILTAVRLSLAAVGVARGLPSDVALELAQRIGPNAATEPRPDDAERFLTAMDDAAAAWLEEEAAGGLASLIFPPPAEPTK